jgi:hypothetical protein
LLPAIAAISTVTAIPTVATISTAPTAASPAIAAASPAVSATTSAATRAFRLGARFVDNKVPATKILTVETGNRTICVFIVADFDEGETARLPGEAITDQTDR